MFALVHSNQDHCLMKDAVKSAGSLALKYFGNTPFCERKQDGSLISEADIAIDRYLKDTLLSERKDYGWLSEETEEDFSRFYKEKIWVIDPIDGTRAFLENKPEWTISAALLNSEGPLCSAIYNPVTEEFFEAELGRGAKLNNQQIFVSDIDDLGKSTVIIPQKAMKFFENQKELQTSNKLWVNSIAYRLCLLSAGKADAVLCRSGSFDWDIAGAALIVHEAGGKVTTFQNQKPTFNQNSPRHNNLVISNNVLHQQLLKICRDIEF